MAATAALMRWLMKHVRLVCWGLLAALLLIQLVRPTMNAGPAEGPQSIVATRPVPDDIKAILRRACYDCHSNATHYPWYAQVQPVGWWLNRHVREGKRELNFSEFSTYVTKRAARKLEHVADEVHDRKMPLKSYLLMHPEARLSDADVKRLNDWADDLSGQIAAP